MVGRVSSFGQQQTLISTLLRNQNRLFEDQRQITTGKQFDKFSGLAGDTNTVLGARSFLSRTETYQSTITEIRGKLDANDNQLGAVLTNARELRQNMLIAVANNRAEGLEELLDEAFRFITSSLNTKIGGSYIFAGAKTGTKPVNVTSLTELAALPTVADAFDNSDVSFSARISDDVELDFGLLADDVAEELFQAMLDIHNFTNGPSGPLKGELDATQFAYIQSQIQVLDSAIDNIQQKQTENGLAFQRLSVVDSQHQDTGVFLATFISDMEDVDIAEAVSNLNRNQLALEVSYQAVSSISELTLLRFL